MQFPEEPTYATCSDLVSYDTATSPLYPVRRYPSPGKSDSATIFAILLRETCLLCIIDGRLKFCLKLEVLKIF